MINNLILSGGGIKGISLIGAIEYLYEKNYMNNINTILGTSIGSIIGYLIIIGYTPEELYNIIIIPTEIRRIANVLIKYFGSLMIREVYLIDQEGEENSIYQISRLRSLDILYKFFYLWFVALQHFLLH